MASFSGLGIGLSFLVGCVLLGFVAEVYYLLWWKRRFSQRREDIENQHLSSSSYAPTDLSHLFCWKNPNSSKINQTQENFQDSVNESENQVQEEDAEMGLGKDLLLKSSGDESVDLELMRLHNLCGPPRFLFTINEETKEDLESERSRKGSRTRSLSDLLVTLDTPFLTPLSSPPLKPNLEGYHQHGWNPLFEPNEIDINRLKSSPPPTFKFLRDAEEKLLRRLMQLEAEKRAILKKEEGSVQVQDSPKTEQKDGSFVKLVVSKKYGEGRAQLHQHQTSTPSQVLPLASSPSTTNSPIDK